MSETIKQGRQYTGTDHRPRTDDPCWEIIGELPAQTHFTDNKRNPGLSLLAQVRSFKTNHYRVDDVCGKNNTLAHPMSPDLKIRFPGVFDSSLEPGTETSVIKKPPVAGYHVGTS